MCDRPKNSKEKKTMSYLQKSILELEPLSIKLRNIISLLEELESSENLDEEEL